MLTKDAAMKIQASFLAKKRKRIELMQTQEKEVVYSQLTVSDFREMLSNTNGKVVAPLQVAEKEESPEESKEPSSTMDHLSADDLLRKV